MALFQCGDCGHRQSLADEFVGRTARCPDCRQLSQVQPDAGSVPDEAPATRPRGVRYGRITLTAIAVAVIAGAYLSIWNGGRRPPTAAGRVPGEMPLVQRFDQSDVSRPSSVPTDGSLARQVEPTSPSPSETALGSEKASVPKDAGTSPYTKRIETTPVNAAIPPEIAPEELAQRIAAGKELFEHQWKPHDRLAGGGDGLGPLFNAHSCAECHFQGGIGGSGTNSHNVQAFEVLPSQTNGEVRGGVIHAFAVSDELLDSKVRLNRLLDSPKVPMIVRGDSGRMTVDAVRTVFMNTPALWGNGLIDQISDQQLMRLEAQARLTGRFRRLPNGKIGKFGWKGQVASLHEFVGGACAAELGLTNSVRSQQEPANYRDDLAASSDLTDEQVVALTSFVAQLPPPQQVLPQNDRQRSMAEDGHKLFVSIGCSNCHVQNVGVAQGVYSDFRLHNVITSLSAIVGDEKYYVGNIEPVYPPPSYYPQLTEWKTPPLWGVADTAPYWHDGSAPTLSAAILKHDQEALAVSEAYKALSKEQQAQMLAFLQTLKAPSLGP